MSTQTKYEIRFGAERAIALCNECPFKEVCLEEGMEPDNVRWGIWGGLTAGERLMLAGIDAKNAEYNTEEAIAWRMTTFLLPHLETNEVTI